MASFVIRQAERGDVALILEFIRELAAYEHLSDQVTATEDVLTEWIFNKQKAQVLIGEADGNAVGYVLYFYNFSTFLGRAGIYIEDLYVKPEYRQKGYGKAFFKHLTERCSAEGCGRLEWSCLDWNKPSIDFYLSLGAQRMDEWTAYRLTEEAIGTLAKSAE